ncbi:MAG: TonB family protein [Pseudomonadota bacterium]
MTLFRWLVGLPMAGLITISLFFLMAGLIRDRGEAPPSPQPYPKIKITPELVEHDPRPKPPIGEALPDAPPPPEFSTERQPGPDRDFFQGPGPITVDPTPPGQKTAIGPVIRIPPPYPESCRARGAQGSVVVEFDVSPEGNVVNPRVISSPDRCFVRPVIKAVSGWKYPPAAGGGMRYGVIEGFSFELTD